MLGNKMSFNKYGRVEIIQSIFSDHNGIKVKISNRRKSGKFTNTWKLNNKFINNKVKEESQGKLENTLK